MKIYINLLSKFSNSIIIYSKFMKAQKKQSETNQRRYRKHTHTRFYTQSTAIDDKTNELKQKSQENHTFLRKYNLPLFSLAQNKDHMKKINKKNTMIQRSIFNQITLFSPKLKKFNTQVQHFHPLKEYFNNGQHQFRFSKVSFQQVKSKRLKSAIFNQQVKKKLNLMPEHPNYQKCKRLIDQIFKQLQMFRNVGFTEKKINQWIFKYCITRRNYMISLLMKPFSKKKFNNKVDYVFEKRPNFVKQKLLMVRKIVNGSQRYIDQYDLRQFLQHMQEILIQKNNLKVKQLTNSIQEKIEECFIYNREQNQNRFKGRKQNGQVTNFISDLNNIEDQLGKFRNISNLNRSYFNMLGKAQKQIRLKVNHMIDIKQNKPIEIIDNITLM